MNKTEKFCLDALRTGDRDRYLSLLFAKEQKRNALAALYAFNLEIASLSDKIKEPLLGEVRLQWWRDALNNKDENADYSDTHPILKELLNVIKINHLPKLAFIRYLDARIFDLYHDPMPDKSTMEAYCGETASAMLQLASTILDGHSAKMAFDASGHGGVAQAICGFLRLLPYSQAKKQVFLAADIIQAVGIDVEKFNQNALQDEEKQRLIMAFVALAREHYTKFLVYYKELPKTLRPAFLPLAIVPNMLIELEKNAILAFQQPITLSPLKHLWLISKAGIKGKMPKI